MDEINQIQKHVTFLYGQELGSQITEDLDRRLNKFRQQNPTLLHHKKAPEERLTETDSILITYGDQFRQPNRTPLAALTNFLERDLKGVISGVHILPFYPYSSDDGFSVIDYLQVDPDLGAWEDIDQLGQHFRLMFDAVINHISRESAWFQGFINRQEPYADYFIPVDPAIDLSMVVRPRALPLLTPVNTLDGVQHVWTTFSDDQIDLNYANPQVLLDIIDVLLLYVERGAEIIRLDAIAYLWKEIGTPCIHLPQTHTVVKLFRSVLEAVAPGTILITETNVPHKDNISYFGAPLADTGQYDEAQMVYQFPLAPLVLHTFHTQSAEVLSAWAETIKAPSADTTFFNFIASHDGIGVMPAQGLLSEGDIQALVTKTIEHGGEVSYKTNADGSRSVYELNITLYDALNNPANPTPDRDIKRFLASQAIMLSLAGVPGIYIHSLFGSRNCRSCVAESGRARSINREKFNLPDIEQALMDPDSITQRVFSGYLKLLKHRRQHRAFHPNASQLILNLHRGVFSLVRQSTDHSSEAILCLVNVTSQELMVPLIPTIPPLTTAGQFYDLLEGHVFKPGNTGTTTIRMGPYQIRWMVVTN